MKLKAFVFGILCALPVAFPFHADAAVQPAEWNILFFLNAKSAPDQPSLQQEMQDFVLKNLYAMSDVNGGNNVPLNLPANVNILVEYGISQAKWDPTSVVDRNLDLCKVGVKRFRMLKGLNQVAEPDSAFQDLGHVDMGVGQSLVDFAAWSRKFPARRTVLYIFDHGSNYVRSSGGLFSFDEETGHAMNAKDISDAFHGMASALGRPIELFVTDMCLVGSAEALGELDGSLRFYVASRENVHGYSISVIDILRQLERLPGLDAKRWAYQIVLLASKSNTDTNFSGFNLQNMQYFEASLANMITALKRQSPAAQAAFQTHFLKECRFPSIGASSSFEFRDILSCFYSMPGMKDWPEFQQLEHDLVGVMYTNSSNINASGMSIWAGQYRMANATPAALADYRTLRFDQGAHWSDFIELMGTGRSPRM